METDPRSQWFDFDYGFVGETEQPGVSAGEMTAVTHIETSRAVIFL